MIRPPRLRSGQTVGIVSPSWGGAGAYPRRFERGVRHLEGMGFLVRVADHALGRDGHVSGSPEDRAADIHALFRDPAVGAVIAAIGGDHSCQLLPHLDFGLIASHPKVFMGFSDVTVLNIAIWVETGLVTFNGPAILTDFAEFPTMLAYTQRYFQAAVCSAEPIGRIEPSETWTQEVLDWGGKDSTRAREHRDNSGCTWLKPGVAEGPLVGGCLESLQHLRGTRFWPPMDGALLFVETSEDKPSPATIDGILMDYENMGVLGKIAGLLVGRPIRYTDAEKIALREVILDRTRGFDFPIATDLDFGHTSPQFTLPIGCRGRMDSQAESLEILDAGVV